MKWRNRRGFTLIELMVTLVVAGILMAGLVALSGSVQRSFGNSKEIVDAQARLRMGMIKTVEDLKRAAYMFTLHPRINTYCSQLPTQWEGLPVEQRGPVSYTDNVLTIRGNFISSRDYRVTLDYARDQVTIVCRDRSPYLPEPKDECAVGVSSTPQGSVYKPFFDGPRFEDVFCEDTIIRLVEGENICYYTVVNTMTVPFATVQLKENLIGERIQSHDTKAVFINPITSINYWLENKGPKGSQGASNWALMRNSDDCPSTRAGNPAVSVIENLLPRDDPHAPGLQIQVYVDSNSPQMNDPVNDASSAPRVAPDIRLSNPIDLIPPGTEAIDWMQVRAINVTMRVRTDSEDPNFVISDYTSNPTQAKNYGYDLDGVPENGLAHVRVAHMLIQLRNISLMSHPVQRMRPVQ